MYMHTEIRQKTGLQIKQIEAKVNAMPRPLYTNRVEQNMQQSLDYFLNYHIVQDMRAKGESIPEAHDQLEKLLRERRENYSLDIRKNIPNLFDPKMWIRFLHLAGITGNGQVST
jgi:hypothetical protein